MDAPQGQSCHLSASDFFGSIDDNRCLIYLCDLPTVGQGAVVEASDAIVAGNDAPIVRGVQQ